MRSSKQSSRTRRWLLLATAAALGAAMVPADQASAAPAGKVAWVGSPVAGKVSSSPSNHHVPFGGQWAVDLYGADREAKVYVAVDQKRDPRLSTRIIDVNYACAQIPWDSERGANQTAARRLSRGGKKVTVGVYFDGSLIGRIHYAHVDTTLPIGQQNRAVNRWGGSIGTVGNYTAVKKPDGSTCWDGRHIHVEMSNVSGRSCYWSGLTTINRSRSKADYLGYLGYNSPTRACPNGI